MRPVVTDRVAWAVCQSVCHTGEPDDSGSRVGPKNHQNHVLDGVQNPWWEESILGERGGPF